MCIIISFLIKFLPVPCLSIVFLQVKIYHYFSFDTRHDEHYYIIVYISSLLLTDNNNFFYVFVLINLSDIKISYKLVLVVMIPEKLWIVNWWYTSTVIVVWNKILQQITSYISDIRRFFISIYLYLMNSFQFIVHQHFDLMTHKSL